MHTPCPFCGNNPVPHHLYWYNESLNIWLTPLRQKLLYNFFTRFIKKHGLEQKIAKIFLFLGENLKIISRQKDILKCKVRRAQVLWEEAKKRGVEMEELLLFGRPFDTYVAKKFEIRNSKFETNIKIQNPNFKNQTIIFSGLPRPIGYTNRWLDLMDDKWLLKKKLIDEYLPVPCGAAVISFGQALKVFKQISEPAIVKPRSGSRGRHSTTFVYDEKDLHRAFKIAKQLCYWVMVEEQLFGPVYRATVVNFELCGVLRGDPPQVVGDGEHTIAQLIKTKNDGHHPGVKNMVADETMEIFLSRQNLKLTSVLKKGQVVNLSEKIGVNYGGSSCEDFEVCHPDNKQLFEKAAKILGDPIVGFDFIIANVAKSYKEQKCGFIEVNSLPFINLHHDPLLGKPQNVAAKVWEVMGY